MVEEVFGFGFRIARDPYGVDSEYGQSWTVTLPHQCDAWEIVEESYPEPTTRAEAIAELSRFIAEATRALNIIQGLSDDWKGEVSVEDLNAKTPT